MGIGVGNAGSGLLMAIALHAIAGIGPTLSQYKKVRQGTKGE